jgi:hypothetical protein
VNFCSEDEGEAGVRWLFLWFFFPCFCFVFASLSILPVHFLPASLFLSGFIAKECQASLRLKRLQAFNPEPVPDE